MYGKIALPGALLLSITMFGCGAPAAPRPPSLNLPIPVTNLSAERIGNVVHLAWTMPLRTTDRVAIVHAIPVQVCRVVEAGSCVGLGELLLAPGGHATYTDDLPADLIGGPDRLLRYEVDVRNHAGKSAGPSNAAYSAAGACPPPLTGLTAQVQAKGIQLNWQPAVAPGQDVFFRIQRLQLTAEAPTQTPRSPLAPATPSAAQTLVVHVASGVDPAHAVDASALFNQRYRYVVERVARVVVSGQTMEVQGQPSGAVEVTATDIFPPAVPQGLVAVADTGGGAIDLSWAPDSESDLAAYHVFRRDTHTAAPSQRISSTGLETSFRDTGVVPGHTYAYAVSAIDQTGNESQPSPEVEETLPQDKEPANP